MDAELVDRGLARSRGHARELLAAGQVLVDGIPSMKASARVTEGMVLALADPSAPVWVGRAAGKLLAALERFGPAGLCVSGRRCLDVGASVGGFTEVLLHHGAEHVVALDVGHGQLAASVATDARVTERSGTNVRDLGTDPDSVAGLGGPFDVVVADLSFISLRLVLPTIAALTRPDGDVVLLVKPQFEVGRDKLGSRGLVRRDSDRTAALLGVVEAAAQAGLGLLDVMPSPIRGIEGNREYLGWWAPRHIGRPGPALVRFPSTELRNGPGARPGETDRQDHDEKEQDR